MSSGISMISFVTFPAFSTRSHSFSEAGTGEASANINIKAEMVLFIVPPGNSWSVRRLGEKMADAGKMKFKHERTRRFYTRGAWQATLCLSCNSLKIGTARAAPIYFGRDFPY